MHRGDGAKNHKGCHEGHCKARFWHSSNGWHARQPFQFGYLYTHFFYTLHGRAPHRITATTGEFCLGAAQDTADCESTQFISGIEHFGAGRDRLLLTFGVNDCEAKVAVWWRFVASCTCCAQCPGRRRRCACQSDVVTVDALEALHLLIHEISRVKSLNN